VDALLVELDQRNVDAAVARVRQAELTGVRVLCADGSRIDSYRSHIPAHIVVVCGVLGHLAPHDRTEIIRKLPSMVDRKGCVIWNRNPSGAASVRAAFAESGFAEVAFVDVEARYGVGMHRLVEAAGIPLEADRLFTFLDSTPVPKR